MTTRPPQQRNYNPFETSSILQDRNSSQNSDPEDLEAPINMLNPPNQQPLDPLEQIPKKYTLFFCITILPENSSTLQKFINYYFIVETVYAFLMLLITFLSLFDKLNRHNFIPGLLFYGIPIFFCLKAYRSFNSVDDDYLTKFKNIDFSGLLTFFFNIFKGFMFFGGFFFMTFLLLGNKFAEREMKKEASKWGEDEVYYKKPKVEIAAIVFCFVSFWFVIGQIGMYYKFRDLRLLYLLRMDRIRNN